MSSDEELLMDDGGSDSIEKFNFEEFVNKNRVPVVILLVGMILIGLGAFLFKKSYLAKSSGVEVLEATTESESTQKEVVVEIAGAVEKPGVYKMSSDARVNDLLEVAGGLTSDADSDWVEKTINKAAKLVDGQKLYIPNVDEVVDKQTNGVSANFDRGSTDVLGSIGGGQIKYVNINTATQSELEELWGIGPVYAQKIIEYRPYSSVEELLTKDVIKENVYERNHELLTVY